MFIKINKPQLTSGFFFSLRYPVKFQKCLQLLLNSVINSQKVIVWGCDLVGPKKLGLLLKKKEYLKKYSLIFILF